MRSVFALFALLAWWQPVMAADCAKTDFEGVPFTWCSIDPAAETLRLWLQDEDGAPFGRFASIDGALAEQGLKLGIAMNGGMYHVDRSTVGLYVEQDKELAPIVTADGPGNFGLLPNGVFCIGDGWAHVVESRAFSAQPLACRFATQSGPMLVIAGALHPRFLPDSDSLKIRNGVGVRADGTVVLAISDARVNFHRFARFFRDQLGAPHALYLDGSVSQLYAPEIGRRDRGVRLGPILGTVEPAG